MFGKFACVVVCLGVALPVAAQNMVTVTETATVWLRPTNQSNALETVPAGTRLKWCRRSRRIRRGTR